MWTRTVLLGWWAVGLAIDTAVPTKLPPKLAMEPATLSCPNKPILSLHLPDSLDSLEKAVQHFLVRYVPLVDGLMKFTSHNLYRCLMNLNDRLPARIDPSAVFHTHIFTYIDHVEIWNCPGSFGEVAYYLEKNQALFRDMGISRIYFLVLATERQFQSFHRLNNLSVHSDFVRLMRHDTRIHLSLANPFQTQSVGRVDAAALPLCQLGFPTRVDPESGNLSVWEEEPLFTGTAVHRLKSLSLALAGLVLTVVLIVSVCLGACWLGERRQERLTVYKGLHMPTEDYHRSYADLAMTPIPPALQPLRPLGEMEEVETTLSQLSPH